MGFGERLLELLFPAKCPFCSELLEESEEFCGGCQRKLPWMTGAAAETKIEFVSRCVSPLIYDELIRAAVHRYKFQGVSRHKKPFGRFMAQCVQDQFSEAFDIISWVPLHKKRRAERGYDQAKFLAVEVGEHRCVPVVGTLVKIRETAAQSGIETDEERRANVLGCYQLLENASVVGQRILLVDDVVTTGATMAEAARMLRMAGAADVCAVTLAKARK